jgi:predicted alpha/beta superfamily hydrolase
MGRAFVGLQLHAAWKLRRRAAVLRRVVLVLLAACGSDPAPSTEAETSSTGEPATTLASVTGASTSSTSSSSTADASTSSSGEGSSESGEPTVDACERFDALVVELENASDDERRSLATSFVDEALYSEHGFPLRCDDGRHAFVALDPASSDLAVVGDFNDWDPRAHPLAQPVADFPLHVAFVDGIASPSLYKLVLEGADYRADPLARRFGWDEFGEYSLTAARDDASHHERWPAFEDPAGVLAPRDVVVYVPAGAFDRTALPVLYMHDGQNLFAPDAPYGGWQVSLTADALIERGTIDPILVVAIDNTNARFDEYTHVVDDLGRGPVGGRGEDYAALVVDGIKPLVDARYPTDPARESTAVAGSSLGGLVSMYIAWLHPDVFGRAASMSGTFGWGTLGLDNETIADLYMAEAPDGLVVYLDSGGSGPCPGGGADNYCVTVELADLLRDLGWVDESDLFYRFTPDASHDEAAWAARVPGMLSDWFPG